MAELSKISRSVKKASPEASLETLLVLDAITGQNAISQAKEFCKAADATGADWSKNTIAKAAELGLVAADLDGAKAISRLEFCQVAAKLNKLAESKTESKFTDCTDGYVMALVDAKVISGMTETTFEPAASLTRAQIAKILYQLTLIEK